MEGVELKEGKRRVRQWLIDPLIKRGMVRRRGQTVADLELMLDSLEARLSYMLADHVMALAEVVERYAEGPKRNIWPPEISICNWALRLQQPPAGQSRLVRSYLQSGAGDAAKTGGYLVELFLYLKKFGVPPNTYASSQIQLEADRNRRRRVKVQQDQERGIFDGREAAWVEQYMQTRRRCLDIMKAKQGAAE